MKAAAVYYFSGTGNTEIIAKLVKEELVNQGFSVDLFRMEDILKRKSEITVDKYDLIGIGNPVYGSGSPWIVYDFIKAMPRGNRKEVFIFMTAGGVAPPNYNAAKQSIRMLAKKDYNVFHNRLFSLGSNWITKFKDQVSFELYQAAKRKVKMMCAEIAAGKTRVMKTEFPLSVLSGTITFFHDLGVRFFAKDYAVSPACNLCGKCVRNCPTGNIFQKNGKIKFKLSCLWCMRCVYGCPQNAIRHRLLSFCVVSGGYDIQKTIENPNPSDQNGITPPFFQKYLENDEM
jgi:ferredoxin